MSKAKKGYVLKFSEAQKKFFEALLQELDRESKKPLPFRELDRIIDHRTTVIFVLNSLKKEEE